MATTTTTTNKPLNPRAQDLSPKGYNRANIFSGKALSFDGVNDLVEIGSSAFSSYAQVSFAIHFRTTSGGGVIVQKENVFRLIHQGDKSLQFVLATSANGWYSKVLTITNVDFSRDYFLSAAYDGTELKLYLNGLLAGTLGGFSGTLGTSVFNATIGSGVSSLYYSGRVSGFKVFNTALSPAQVSDLYLNPEKIVPDGVASSALKLWLPMMEGAGASAYDGSGNGNDGTINGATWTAGIGAPVAQTALVSWDKGTNLLLYSEDFTNGAWSKEDITITANATTAPNGTTTADFLIPNTTNTDHTIYRGGIATGSPRKFSLYAKAGGQNYIFLGSNNNAATDGAFFNLSNGTISQNTSTLTAAIESVGNGWYLCSVSSSAWPQIYAIICGSLNGTSITFAGDNTNGVYIWGASFRPTSDGDAYIKTNATAQTSAVLVPEGLTAGASIFGIDIITPRNAFALNLDGASWAQVGDNASLDISPAMTMEVWARLDATATTKHFLVKSSGSWTPPYGRFVIRQTGAAIQWWFEDFANNDSISYSTEGWAHFVVTKNGTAEVLYVNGVQVETNTGVATITASAFPLYIGRADNGEYIDKQLANPRIYNRALTAAEVLRNYNADKAKFGL